MSLLRVILLGRVTLLNDAGLPVPLKHRKAFELVAYLASRRGEACTRADLEAFLFPDHLFSAPDVALRKAICLAMAALPPGALAKAGDCVGLDADSTTTDHSDVLELFTILNTEKRISERMTALDGVESLLANPLKTNSDWLWLADLRSDVAKARIRAYLAHARFCIDSGDWAEATRASTLVLRMDRVNQEACFLAMRAQHELGMPGAAGDLYRALDDALLEENGGTASFSIAETYASRVTEGPIPREPLVELGKARVKGGWTLWRSIGICVAVVLAAVSLATAVARRRGVSVPPRPNPPIMTLHDAELAIQQADAHPNVKNAELARAKACAWIAESGFDSLWTPDEPRWIAEFNRFRDDMKRAIRWSLTHDPDTALRILGNGHRYFKMIGEKGCPAWLVEARAADPDARSIAMCRTLCGIAYFNWNHDYDRGLRCARIAAGMAQSLGSLWDEANALRHEGLCCYGMNNGRYRLYRQALAIFTQLRDLRGIAMTQQSFSEQSFPETTKGSTDGATLAASALTTFRLLGNLRLQREEMGTLSKFVERLPPGAAFASYRKTYQAELAKQADIEHCEGDPFAEVCDRVKFIQVSFSLGRFADMASGMRAIITDPDHRQHGSFGAWLQGAYASVVRRSRLSDQPRLEIALDTAKDRAMYAEALQQTAADVARQIRNQLANDRPTKDLL